MKPRIFIAIHYMHLGGVETSLIGLLQALDPAKVDIDLFVYSHEGELMRLVPSYVNLLAEHPTWRMFEKPLRKVLFRGHLRMFFARMRAKLRMRRYVKKNNPKDESAIHGYLGEEVSKILPDLYHLGEYDLAISYLNPHNFVLDHVSSKKKVCWIHTDYTRIDVNAELEFPVWNSFDNLISISEDVTKTFLHVFPSLRHKVTIIENILSPFFVCSRAGDDDAVGMYKQEGEICLLSVGRFCTAKNYDNVPFILKGIREKGINAKWYIIGYGGDEPLIRQKIEEAGMQDYVIILGKKANPYPYIKACDWYVQPSRYEGKSVTVREAQILCKPVIVTNYPTAPSQIQHGVDGVIVPMEISDCVVQMVATLKDETQKSSIVEYLQEHEFGNMDEVDRIYELVYGSLPKESA